MTSGVTCSQITVFHQQRWAGVLRKVVLAVSEVVPDLWSRCRLRRALRHTIPAFLVSVGTIQYRNVRGRAGPGGLSNMGIRSIMDPDSPSR